MCSQLVGNWCDYGPSQLLCKAVCLPKQYVGGQEISSWWESGVTKEVVNCLLKQYACTVAVCGWEGVFGRVPQVTQKVGGENYHIMH